VIPLQETHILIFLALTPTGIYSKCRLLYLHLISHWKVHRPNVFQHLSSSIFSFNEEFGEATSGVLAKSVLSDADYSSFTKLFQTQPFISAVTTATCGKHDTTTTTHSSTTGNGDQDELDLVSNFIEDLFSWIEKNTFVPYSSSVITMKSFTAFSSQIDGDDSSFPHHILIHPTSHGFGLPTLVSKVLKSS